MSEQDLEKLAGRLAKLEQESEQLRKRATAAGTRYGLTWFALLFLFFLHVTGFLHMDDIVVESGAFLLDNPSAAREEPSEGRWTGGLGWRSGVLDVTGPPRESLGIALDVSDGSNHAFLFLGFAADGTPRLELRETTGDTCLWSAPVGTPPADRASGKEDET